MDITSTLVPPRSIVLSIYIARFHSSDFVDLMILSSCRPDLHTTSYIDVHRSGSLHTWIVFLVLDLEFCRSFWFHRCSSLCRLPVLSIVELHDFVDRSIVDSTSDSDWFVEFITSVDLHPLPTSHLLQVDHLPPVDRISSCRVVVVDRSVDHYRSFALPIVSIFYLSLDCRFTYIVLLHRSTIHLFYLYIYIVILSFLDLLSFIVLFHLVPSLPTYITSTVSYFYLFYIPCIPAVHVTCTPLHLFYLYLHPSGSIVLHRTPSHRLTLVTVERRSTCQSSVDLHLQFYIVLHLSSCITSSCRFHLEFYTYITTLDKSYLVLPSGSSSIVIFIFWIVLFYIP